MWARKKEVNALKKEAQNFEATYTIDVKKAEKAITEKMPELENAAKEATIKRENGQPGQKYLYQVHVDVPNSNEDYDIYFYRLEE